MIGIRTGTLRKLLIDAKKLNPMIGNTEALGLEPVGQTENKGVPGLELVFDQGNKIIRFPSVEVLVDFLRKAS